ncbi:MAG TPA: hypothetical protein VN968_03440, partial [Bradyrhizobium sp.]|nr:hypothetical protein [Bradyrhizobium sp.]
AFQRRASAHFHRRSRKRKIATSAITRVYAEKAAQRNGSVRLAQLWGPLKWMFVAFGAWRAPNRPSGALS